MFGQYFSKKFFLASVANTFFLSAKSSEKNSKLKSEKSIPNLTKTQFEEDFENVPKNGSMIMLPEKHGFGQFEDKKSDFNINEIKNYFSEIKMTYFEIFCGNMIALLFGCCFKKHKIIKK